MRPIFTFITALVLVFLLAVGVGGGIAAADTPTDEPGEEIEDLLGSDVEVEQRIDSNLVLVRWSYDGGIFTLEFYAEESTRASFTEAGGFTEGTGSFNYDEMTIAEGESAVTFAVRNTQGGEAAVAIATEESLAQGTGAFVSTGLVTQDPFRHFGGHSGLFSGVLLTVVCAATGAWYVVRSEETGVVRA